MADRTPAKWLQHKYMQWKLDRDDNSLDLEDFANFLGITRGYVSMINSGTRKKVSYRVALRIAERLQDYEILDMMDFARPEPKDLLRDFPPEVRNPILAALSDARSELVKRGIETNTLEAEEILSTAFKRYGVNFTFTK